MLKWYLIPEIKSKEGLVKGQPVIAMIGNEREFPNDKDLLLSYSPVSFVEAVQGVGGLPLIIPIGLPEMAKTYIDMIDKLIITGGQNVLPEFYGEAIESENDDYLRKRDVFEFALIKEARKAKKTIFTVCRGTQIYNVALGGSLHQAIEHHWQDDPGQYTSHDMVTREGTILRQVHGEANRINSFHHRSIKDLAPELEVIARDPRDQTIEAIQSTDGSAYFGVQWHPELRQGHSQVDRELFECGQSSLKLLEETGVGVWVLGTFG